MKKLYVGNFPYSTTEDDLRNLFNEFGNIVSAAIITDKFSGRSKGFGFIEFETEAEAKAAHKLDGQDFGGRPLKVNEAQERRRDDRGGSRGGSRGGNFGGGRDRY